MEKDKRNLKVRLLEFQLAGLEAYQKYLLKEQSNSTSDIKKAYRKYIDKELVSTGKKIEKIKMKIDKKSTP